MPYGKLHHGEVFRLYIACAAKKRRAWLYLFNETMQTVLNKFKFYSDNEHSGLLQVSRAQFKGGIFFQNGLPVHAELYEKSGLDALYELFAWEGASYVWRGGQSPQATTISLPIEQILQKYEHEKLQRKHRSLKMPDTSLVHIPGLANQDTRSITPVDMHKFILVLESRTPDWKPEQYILSDLEKASYIIGSDPSCDICLKHESVAEHHCAILMEGVIRLWDLGTGGATLVNKHVAEDSVLEAGDIVNIGSLAFAIQLKLRRSIPLIPTPHASVAGVVKDTPASSRSHRFTGPISFTKIQKKKQTNEEKQEKSVLARIFKKNRGKNTK